MALTDVLGLLDAPFAHEVTGQYVVQALDLTQRLGSPEAADWVLNSVRHMHFANEMRTDTLQRRLRDPHTFVNGFLYMAVCEKAREVLRLEPEEFYHMLGLEAVLASSWAQTVGGGLTSMGFILGKMAEGTPNFTTLIDIDCQEVRQQGDREIVLVRRKTKKPHVRRLKHYFPGDFKTVLRNDCAVTRGVLEALPRMFKGYEDVRLKQLSCEVEGDACLYELSYKKPKSGLLSGVTQWFGPRKKLLADLEAVDADLAQRRELLNAIALEHRTYVEWMVQASRDIEELAQYVPAVTAREAKRILGECDDALKATPVSPEYSFTRTKSVLPRSPGQLMATLFSLRKLIAVADRRYEAQLEQFSTARHHLEELHEKFFQLLAEAYTQGGVTHAIPYVVDSIERKDPPTQGHTVRVAHWAYAIAQQMGYNQPQLQRIAFEATVHDIGKIAIPLCILAKPGPLTPAERDLMERHAEYTYKIVRHFNIPDAEEIAINAASHHRHIDGSGYPAMLLGNELSWNARILAVADAIESMNSKRCYRERQSAAYIINELRTHSGTQFDPYVASVAENLIRSHHMLEAYGPGAQLNLQNLLGGSY